jgi:hypothetical protein
MSWPESWGLVPGVFAQLRERFVLDMNNVSIGLDNQAILDSLNNPPQANKDSVIDLVRDFSNWLLIFPFVIALIFLSAHLGLLIRYHFAFPNTPVDLTAEYGPWSYMLIHTIRPEIIKDIRFDRANESKSVFQDPETITSSWVGGGTTKDSKSIPPTHTPAPTGHDVTHQPSEPTATPTMTPTPNLTVSPTSNLTVTPTSNPTMIFSPTPTNSPTPTLLPTSTPTMTPTSTSTPTVTPTFTATSGSEFAGLNTYGIYASNGTMDSSSGSITVWLNFDVGQARGDHMIIHSNDSRWVLYIDTFYSSGFDRDILAIAARAGGNKSATSGSSGHSGYPEARLLIDSDGFLEEIDYGADSSWVGVEAFPEGEWHHIAMTWNGYPSGIVRLYLDGVLISYLPYDSSYDNGGALFDMISFGFKPYPWPNVDNLPEYGDVGTGRLASGAIRADDLRIYDSTLSQSAIIQITSAGRGH